MSHVYSRTNSGDGLLLDLTLERLRRVGVDLNDVAVLAMDVESLGAGTHAIRVGTPGRLDRSVVFAGAHGLGTLLSRFASKPLTDAASVLNDAEAIVAVGGGYLRAGTLTNRVGTLLNHVPQLMWVGHSHRPSVFMPQSIGPLRGAVGALVRSRLGRVDALHVRDDLTFAELAGLPGLRRTPDLAVLELADRGPLSSVKGLVGQPVLVARSLGAAPHYTTTLQRLAEALGDVRWAVQAEGPRSKNDAVFYEESLGVSPAGSLRDVLSVPGPVVSVRLHGALEALLQGVPAIHLGYERKSWGAFSDLGLGEWLHDARAFDPDRVADQARALMRDSEPYWQAVRVALPRLLSASERLTESVGEQVGVGSE